MAAAESRAVRRSLTTVGAEFWRHPSPWMLLATVVGALAWLAVADDWRVSALWGPLVYLVTFPLQEWAIHVFVLHWRPRKVGRLLLDYELAHEHRRHHRDPRNIPLVFIPWRSLIGVIVGSVVLAWAAFPHPGQSAAFLVTVSLVGFTYEWTHYLIHSDYKPRSAAYKALWRNHRLHHYRNENYWFNVTTSGTADRLLRTYPAQDAVPVSATAKNLHGG